MTNPVMVVMERESRELLAYRDFLEKLFTPVDVSPGEDKSDADRALLVRRVEFMKAEKRRIYLREAAKLGVRIVLAQERVRQSQPRRTATGKEPSKYTPPKKPARYKPTLAGPSLQGRQDKSAEEIRAMREARGNGNGNGRKEVR
jgi:hypothetical protein